MESLEKDKNIDEKTKEIIKNKIPPPFELRYWSRLNQNYSFLLFGSEEPFDKIFDDMWEFEKINQQIFLSQQTNLPEQQKKQAYVFAMVFYKHTIQDKAHKKLLLNFMNENEIKQMEEEWKKIAQEKI